MDPEASSDDDWSDSSEEESHRPFFTGQLMKKYADYGHISTDDVSSILQAGTQWEDLDETIKNQLFKYWLVSNESRDTKSKLLNIHGAKIVAHQVAPSRNHMLFFTSNYQVASKLVRLVKRESWDRLFNMVNEFGHTILHHVCKKNNIEMAILLLKLVDDKDQLILSCGSDGTALHHVHDYRLAQLLLAHLSKEKQAQLLLSCDKDGNTALHCATRAQRFDVMKCLLNISEPSQPTGSFADWGARPKHTSAAIAKPLGQRLFEVADSCGRTVLHIASQRGMNDFVKYLMSLGLVDEDMLFKCSYENMKFEYGPVGTALHVASHAEMAELLITAVAESERWKFLSTFNIQGKTALHTACKEEKKDVVQYLMSLDQFGSQLVFLCNENGTALHDAKSRDMVALILQAIPPTQRKSLLLIGDEDGNTFLHSACKAGKTSIVEYLLPVKADGEHDEAVTFGHNANVEELWSHTDLVFAINRMGETLLHAATKSGDCKLVSYLLSLSIDTEELLFTMCHQEEGTTAICTSGTALHKAANVETAKVLVDAVSKSRRKEFVTTLNDWGETALHEASDQSTGVPLMKFLLSQVSDKESYVMISGNTQGTALHRSCKKEHAKLLFDSIHIDKHEAFILTLDKEERSALHIACRQGKTDVAAFLLSFGKKMPTRAAVTPKTILLKSYPPTNISEGLITMPDNNGNTPFMHAINSGFVRLVKGMLQFFEITATDVQLQLEHQNSLQQNAFHLAARHTECDRYMSHIRDCLNEVQVGKILVKDIFGNSPLHYAAAMGNVALFATLLMKIPLEKRRFMLMQMNVNRLNPLAIVHRHSDYSEQADTMFVIRSIMNDNVSTCLSYYYSRFMSLHHSFKHGEEVSFPRNPKILNVTMHSILIYSLLDQASTALHQASTSRGHIKHEKNQTLGHVLIDDQIEDGQLDDGHIMHSLWKMDTREKQGQPKVVIRRRTGKRKNISPPGPDFIIIDVQLDPEAKHSLEWMQEILPTYQLEDYITNTCKSKGVLNVSINSTLGKHLPNTTLDDVQHHKSPSPRSHIIEGKSRGKALILCNIKGRPNWKFQYEDALYIFQNQLGLEVTSEFNFSSTSILESIEKFVSGAGDSQIVALVVMAHGDSQGDGDISGVDDQTVTVQQLVNTFCTELLHGVPKLMMLSFCRGRITPIYNMVPYSPETKEIGLIALVRGEFEPAKKTLHPKKIREEYLGHPMPDVVIPPDCHVMYTVLQINKSPQKSITFKEMRSHLEEKINLFLNATPGTPSSCSAHDSAPATSSSADPVSAQPTAADNTSLKKGSIINKDIQAVRPKTRKVAKASVGLDSQFLETKSNTEYVPSLYVELVSLFTDVAGIVRDKSGFRIITNFCYTVDRNSKPVFIKLRTDQT